MKMMMKTLPTAANAVRYSTQLNHWTVPYMTLLYSTQGGVVGEGLGGTNLHFLRGPAAFGRSVPTV